MSGQFKDLRTVEGKTYTAHDLFPDIGSACADWGRSIRQPYYFPRPEEWGMVADWIGDFGELPGGEYDHSEFIEAVAKEYVGYTEKMDEPDPEFWVKIAKQYSKYGIEV